MPDIIILFATPHGPHQLTPRAVSANETPQWYRSILRLVSEHDAFSDLQNQALTLVRSLWQVEDEITYSGFYKGPGIHVELILLESWGGWLREGNGRQRLCGKKRCEVHVGAAVGKEGVKNKVDDGVEGVEEEVGDFNELTYGH